MPPGSVLTPVVLERQVPTLLLAAVTSVQQVPHHGQHAPAHTTHAPQAGRSRPSAPQRRSGWTQGPLLAAWHAPELAPRRPSRVLCVRPHTAPATASPPSAGHELLGTLGWHGMHAATANRAPRQRVDAWKRATAAQEGSGGRYKHSREWPSTPTQQRGAGGNALPIIGVPPPVARDTAVAAGAVVAAVPVVVVSSTRRAHLTGLLAGRARRATW